MRVCDAWPWRGLRGDRTADRPNVACGDTIADCVTDAAVERNARAQLLVLSGELGGGWDWMESSEPQAEAAERQNAWVIVELRVVSRAPRVDSTCA